MTDLQTRDGEPIFWWKANPKVYRRDEVTRQLVLKAVKPSEVWIGNNRSGVIYTEKEATQYLV